jgi:tRNA A37 threonylcarbamoyladenosine synthetase subunit TsaC/SUA5/YrdC
MNTEVINVQSEPISSEKLAAVAAALAGGKPAVFPTDTVYGIGVSAGAAGARDLAAGARAHKTILAGAAYAYL